MKACQLLMRNILGGDFIQDSVCVCVCFPKSVYRKSVALVKCVVVGDRVVSIILYMCPDGVFWL